jgi:nucleoside-diphosphate-sugar epimerase
VIDSKKSILILGTGYIGSSIIDAFYDSHNIIAIDHGKNFQKLKNKFPEVNFVIGDCTNKIILDEYAKQSNFVFYTLNTGGVMDCILNPEKFKKINISDFKIILDILNKYNLNFILFSSSFIYPDVSFVDENILPNPETFYGKLRLEQEKLLENSALNYVILRLSNIYGFGPFLNLGNLGVIEKFINLTFSKKQITLHGNGLQKLDCMYIDDLIELLKLLLNKPFSSNVFNVSSEKNYSVLEISKIIEQHAMKNFQINLKLTSSENSYTLPNSPLMFSNKIKNFVPWIPKQINIKKKIEQMMDEFSKHIG